MTTFTQDLALTRYVEAGGIRFAYRRLGVPERPPLGAHFQYPTRFVRHARIFLDD